MSSRPAAHLILPALALALTLGCDAKPSDDDPQTTIEPAETHLRVELDGVTTKTGQLIGWNVGRGTLYAPPGDPLHPEWRTPELAAATARLSEARAAADTPPLVRFSGLQIDGVLGEDGYHFWELVDPARGVADGDNMAPFEYFALIDEIGGQGAAPVVMLNFGSGTAAEAGDYVTHLNGADPADSLVAARQHWGREAPYGVRWFELGNEIHALWNTGYSATGKYSYANPEALHGGDPPWHGRPASEPADYAARALEYAATTRARSPDARLWVPLSMADMNAWGAGTDAALAALDPLLLEPSVEAVVVHHYHVDDAETQGLEDINDLQFIVAGAELYRPGFAALRERLTAIGERRGAPLELAVTEYHVAGFFAGSRFERGEQAIVGLGIADMLLLYAQEGVAYACQHMALNFEGSDELLFETWYNPLRADGAGGVFDAPSLQTTAMIAARLHAETVPLAVERAARASAPVGAETLEYPVIHAAAFVDDDRARAAVVALNRDLEAARELSLDVPSGWSVTGAEAFAPDRPDRPSGAGPVPITTPTWSQSVTRVAVTLPAHSLVAVDLERSR